MRSGGRSGRGGGGGAAAEFWGSGERGGEVGGGGGGGGGSGGGGDGGAGGGGPAWRRRGLRVFLACELTTTKQTTNLELFCSEIVALGCGFDGADSATRLRTVTKPSAL